MARSTVREEEDELGDDFYLNNRWRVRGHCLLLLEVHGAADRQTDFKHVRNGNGKCD